VVSRKFGAALAIAAMVFSTGAQAADAVIGTVSSETSALVARDGKVLPAVPGMRLYSGDRLITRAGGSANVTMANSCAVTVGASAMLPMAGASCAKPNLVNFDQGRAGYPGQSSAFQSNNGRGLWALYLALAAIWGSALYVALHHNHHDNNTPTSP
jgi:hypothetical protein